MICGEVQHPWPDALADCRAHGMELVRIDDAEENAWVHQEAFTFGVDRCWLGGSDPMVQGDWRWSDGTPFWTGATQGMPIAGRYTNWDPGEPNNMGGIEHCLVMFAKATWNDEDCATPRRYVCETP
jgi:hypothetical protein